MTELLRLLASLVALFSQLLSSGPLLPFPTPTPSVAPMATATATPQPSATPIPTLTPTLVPTHTPSPVPSATRTATATATLRHVAAMENPVGAFAGQPPAQKLPTAVLIYPLISTASGEDTLIEMMNLTNQSVSVKCHFVDAVNCRGVDFFLNLTALQPIAWRASTGQDGNGFRLAPPVFNGQSRLKCFVQPSNSALSAHNALQGRAIISNTSGHTIGYSATGFRRLTPGTFSGSVQLDGITYEQCPDRLHFTALASQAGSDSELILVPCEENLLFARPTQTNITFAVINEYEQHFSGSRQLNCMLRERFSQLPAFRKTSVGTDTIHAIVRGVSSPVIGMVIDRFTVPGSSAMSVSSNMPFLVGGRASTVTLPIFD